MEMNATKVTTIDDLPELPFKLVLNYLSLADRLKARAVCRSWYQLINSSKVKSICCSDGSSDFIDLNCGIGKIRRFHIIDKESRRVSEAFAQNFISLPRIDSFLATHVPTLLSDLKHLRIYDVYFPNRDHLKAFVRTLRSFSQLEKLDINKMTLKTDLIPPSTKLILPMLISIHFEDVKNISRLTLDSPRLRSLKLWASLKLKLVHYESVERLLFWDSKQVEVVKLKNLKKLEIDLRKADLQIDSTLLSSLEQLKELYLIEPKGCSNVSQVLQLLELKRQYGRTDLKIYRFGCLLNGPEDLLVTRFQDFDDENLLGHLAKNSARLADEIPFFKALDYKKIQSIAPGSAVDLLKRFTDLREITVSRPVQDVQRFLDLLKNLNNISDLKFSCDQPQDLFDRLPEHSVVQKLFIHCNPSNLRFLLRLKHLTVLHVHRLMDVEFVRKISEELTHLSKLRFGFLRRKVKIDYLNGFEVSIDGEKTKFPELNAAIEFFDENLIAGRWGA